MQKILITGLMTGLAAFAASPFADVYDRQVATVEREILGLAQAMPADKYDFAPKDGTFTGVRTFALQVRHIATVMYQTAAAVSGEKAPVDLGTSDNGPDSLKTKDQIIEYFKGALAFAHKAALSIDEKNYLDPVRSPFGNLPRFGAASTFAYHAYDHYGQMVVYGRMNGVIPPSSQPRGRGPAPAATKSKQP